MPHLSALFAMLSRVKNFRLRRFEWLDFGVLLFARLAAYLHRVDCTRTLPAQHALIHTCTAHPSASLDEKHVPAYLVSFFSFQKTHHEDLRAMSSILDVRTPLFFFGSVRRAA